MSDRTQCPTCDIPLTRSVVDDKSPRCAKCLGVFVPNSEIRGEFLEQATLSNPPDHPLCCPGCRTTMQSWNLADTTFEKCAQCGGIWLKAGDQIDANNPSESAESLSRYLLYSLTLPERAVRSTIGLAAGAARESAEFLVPQAFQSSTTYEVVVRNSLKFLTEVIGGVESDDEEDEAPVDDYLARKTVGNFVDLAGLATLHLSPLWLLAIVSDVAYGSKTYVIELANELKAKGLIDESSTINHIDDVLEAVQNSTGQAATMFDTPPLSVEQLKNSLAETRDAITSTDYTTVLPEAEIAQYWGEMKDIAAREQTNLLGVSAAMTMYGLGKMKTVSHGALTGIQVAGGLFDRIVIGHYVDSLKEIRERGFYTTLQESSAPYIEAVWSNFAVDRETWTEDLVSGRTFSKAFETVTGWFRKKDDEDQPSPDQPAPDSNIRST